jgi:hypothetical protein
MPHSHPCITLVVAVVVHILVVQTDLVVLVEGVMVPHLIPLLEEMDLQIQVAVEAAGQTQQKAVMAALELLSLDISIHKYTSKHYRLNYNWHI